MFSNKRISGNIALINSLTIKLSVIATTMNRALSQFGVVFDENDKTTWPYYLNLSGQKHSANTIVTFTTLETNEEVELTLANLAIYQKSKAELLLFSTYFSDLVSRYRGQELYIRGVLNPIDINEAIDAVDGTILYYAPSYVGYNETSLIAKLNSSSKKFLDRWDVKEYHLIENLYAAAIYGLLINFLIMKVGAIRFGNIGTYEISESYIEDTLNSYLGVGQYAGTLSRATKLWLAKNIRYIASNIGQDSTFNLINANLVKPNGVKMYEIDVIQNTPVNNGESDPRLNNTVYSDNVLHKVLKDGTEPTHELLLLSDLNRDIFLDPSINGDYGIDTYKYDRTRRKLIESDLNERTKFYVLHMQDDIIFSQYNISKIVVDALTLFFNQTSGLQSSGSSTLQTTNGFSYSLLNSDIYNYIIYGQGMIDGYSGINTIDGIALGSIVEKDISSLIRHDFVIADALANLHNTNKLYEEILINIKSVLLDPATADITAYINGQLAAQSILGACSPRIDGPIQEAEFLSIIDCISYSKTPILQSVTYDDLLISTGFNDVYSDFNKTNVTDAIESLSGITTDKNAKSKATLEAIRNIVKALTSYTVMPIIDSSFSDEFVNTGKIGAMEGESIVMIQSADIRCGVVSSEILDASGDDSKIGIEVMDEYLLYSETNSYRNMGLIIDGMYRPGVYIERPELISE